MASNKLISVSSNQSEKQYANSDSALGLWESFEPKFIDYTDLENNDAEIGPLSNGTLIGFKSLATGNYLGIKSNETTRLYADANELHYNEIFEIYFINANVIGIKSKATNKFVCAYPSPTRSIVVDRDELDEWETFEIVPT